MFKVFFDTKSKQPWVLRIIQKGDKYGSDGSGLPELIHDGIEPLVEFYDGRFEQTEYGRFVNRFFVRVMLQRGPHEIKLDRDNQQLKIHDDCMHRVHQWLNKVAMESQAVRMAA